VIDHHLRKSFQKKVIDPILPNFSKVSPSLLTILALISGILCSIMIVYGFLFWAIFALIISGLFDVLDGSVARLQGCASAKGSVLDITSDRLVEFFIILGLFIRSPEHGLAFFIMLGSVLICITTFLVVGIFIQNEGEKSFHYSPGVIERTEAFILFGLMIVFPSYLVVLTFIFSSLIFLTGFVRLFEFFRLPNR